MEEVKVQETSSTHILENLVMYSVNVWLQLLLWVGAAIAHELWKFECCEWRSVPCSAVLPTVADRFLHLCLFCVFFGHARQACQSPSRLQARHPATRLSRMFMHKEPTQSKFQCSLCSLTRYLFIILVGSAHGNRRVRGHTSFWRRSHWNPPDKVFFPRKGGRRVPRAQNF